MAPAFNSCWWLGLVLCWRADVCLRDLPCVPSPVPGGRMSSTLSCEAACCDFGNTGLCRHLSAQAGSECFVLIGMLAGFLHSRPGITITKCHHHFGSSAGQTGCVRDLGALWTWWGCSTLRHEQSGTASSRMVKRLHVAPCGLQRS